MSEKTSEFTTENKFKWISRMYFSVSDSPNHDVNPFEDIKSFLDAKVSDLDWGKGADTRLKSKERFADKFIVILDMYDFKISKVNILKTLSDESISNKAAVEKMAAAGEFPHS